MVDFIALIATLAAVGGLIFSGISFMRLGKTEELKLVERVYTGIARSLKQFNLLDAESPKSTTEEEEIHSRQVEHLLLEFFADLNWLCYLIRHGQIKDNGLINAFRDQIITWHNLFEHRVDRERVENKTSFADFKYLYAQMKLEIDKEIAFTKKHPHITKLKTLIQIIVWKLKRRRFY